MANSLLDLTLRKNKTSFPERNTMLSFVKDGTLPVPQVEPVSSSDDVVAQTAEANANALAPVKTVPDFTGALQTPLSQPPAKNIIAQTPATTPYVPQTEYEKYWKTPVGTEKYNMPLDQFTKIAGLAAKYLDPKNPIANDLIKMGGEAYNERAKREYESPNVLLQRRLHDLQIKELENKSGILPAWNTYYKSRVDAGETDKAKIVSDYNEMLNRTKAKPKILVDEYGNTSGIDQLTGGVLWGSGRGQDASNLIKTTATSASGDVTPISRTGKPKDIIPKAGKPLIAPGAAGAAADARKQAKETQEGRKFKTTYKNPETGQLVYETEGTENNPPSHYVVDAKGSYRKATPDELKGLFKVATEKTKKEAKTNPFRRGEASARPNTRAAMISDLQQRNKGMSKQAVEEYVTKNYPELK